VVVVECLFNRDEDADIVAVLEGLGLVAPGFGVVVAWNG
jgi:hypothetical protein